MLKKRDLLINEEGKILLPRQYMRVLIYPHVTPTYIKIQEIGYKKFLIRHINEQNYQMYKESEGENSDATIIEGLGEFSLPKIYIKKYKVVTNDCFRIEEKGEEGENGKGIYLELLDVSFPTCPDCGGQIVSFEEKRKSTYYYYDKNGNVTDIKADFNIESSYSRTGFQCINPKCRYCEYDDDYLNEKR